jgi:MSHA biogenesis protein MshJ
MKAFWTNQARRIDALSLRERVIMFASVVLALGALADALVLTPALATRRALAAQMRQDATELDAMRRQVVASSDTAKNSPQARQRSAIEAARTELQALDAQVQQRLGDQTHITRLPELLERVLRRHDRLVLTKLATVPAEPARADAPAALRWQGVDLGVAGSYLDLMHYLAELERELPGLRWGALQIGTQTTPPQMTVRLLLAGESR